MPLKDMAHLLCKQRVGGSSPPSSTGKINPQVIFLLWWDEPRAELGAESRYGYESQRYTSLQ